MQPISVPLEVFDALSLMCGIHVQMSGREILTVIDDNGCMWQMSIDGSKVKVINSTPAQVGSRT